MKAARQLMSGSGVSVESIARVLGISSRTLQKHYRGDLDDGLAEVEAILKRNATQLAMGVRNPDGSWREPPDRVLLIFLLKTRYGYREVLDVNNTMGVTEEASAAVKRIGDVLDQYAALKRSGVTLPRLAATGAPLAGLELVADHDGETEANGAGRGD